MQKTEVILKSYGAVTAERDNWGICAALGLGACAEEVLGNGVKSVQCALQLLSSLCQACLPSQLHDVHYTAIARFNVLPAAMPQSRLPAFSNCATTGEHNSDACLYWRIIDVGNLNCRWLWPKIQCLCLQRKQVLKVVEERAC